MPQLPRIGAVADEFTGAAFGDARLTSRLGKVAEAVAPSPGASFPQLARTDGELEGVYRFLNNDRVSATAILAPHIAATRERAGADDVLVVHDTTEFTFGGWTPREGLGPLRGSSRSQGFLGHFALAVAGDGSRRPLGLLGLRTIVRSRAPASTSTLSRRRRRKGEYERWADLALDVHAALPQAIHVMDREADSFEVFAKLAMADASFVIRLRDAPNRVVELEGARPAMSSVVAQQPVRMTRDVPLSRRVPHEVRHSDKRFPPRRSRMAKLEVRAAAVTLPRPNDHRLRGELPARLEINVVLVEEVGHASYVEPVSWMIATTLPIKKRADLERIVEAYRARWTIEEYFKALKTGCAYERRQLETFRSLVNALAVFAVIAWRLLLLRSTARLSPKAPATHALSEVQVNLLKTLSRMKASGVPKITFPDRPTTDDALRAVAKLGGHIKNNGPPGWQVLGRGYDSLLLLQLGWKAHEQCDR